MWPFGEHTVFLGVYWSMKENEGDTVAFVWDTETLLTEQNISNLKLNKLSPFSPTPTATKKGKLNFIAVPKSYLLECGFSWGNTCCQKYVATLTLRREIIFTYQ